MLERIHQKLGTAGFVISVVALIAALGGGAYAASGGLTPKQKKEVEKIAKKYAGKPGTTGAAGTTGAKGDSGPAGANGSPGNAGSNGVSPVGTKFAGAKSGSGCSNGGVEFTGANTTFACNGTTGFTETLPEGQTETGTFSLSQSSTTEHVALTQISFSIPLEAEGKSPLEEGGVPKAGAEGSAFVFTELQVQGEKFGKIVNTEPGGEKFVTTTACKVEASAPNCLDSHCRGSATTPTAPAGVLCVYLFTFEQNPKAEGEFELSNLGSPTQYSSAYSTAGAILGGKFLNGTAGEPAAINAYGSWAVTAPES